MIDCVLRCHTFPNIYRRQNAGSVSHTLFLFLSQSLPFLFLSTPLPAISCFLADKKLHPHRITWFCPVSWGMASLKTYQSSYFHPWKVEIWDFQPDGLKDPYTFNSSSNCQDNFPSETALKVRVWWSWVYAFIVSWHYVIDSHKNNQSL